MNEKDYGFGPEAIPDAGCEKRSEYRLAARARVMIEVESADPVGKAGERWLACGIRDVSARGLCLVSPEPLPVGAILQVVVALGQEGETFPLTVEVIWTRLENEQILSGARILEAEGSAVPEWLEAIASALTDT